MSQRVARGVCIYWPAANYTRHPINHGSLTQCSFIFTGDASARERRRYGRAPLPLPSLAAAFTVFLFRSFSGARSHLSVPSAPRAMCRCVGLSRVLGDALSRARHRVESTRSAHTERRKEREREGEGFFHKGVERGWSLGCMSKWSGV